MKIELKGSLARLRKKDEEQESILTNFVFTFFSRFSLLSLNVCNKKVNVMQGLNGNAR